MMVVASAHFWAVVMQEASLQLTTSSHRKLYSRSAIWVSVRFTSSQHYSGTLAVSRLHVDSAVLFDPTGVPVAKMTIEAWLS
jgi:hypothetical protein